MDIDPARRSPVASGYSAWESGKLRSCVHGKHLITGKTFNLFSIVRCNSTAYLEPLLQNPHNKKPEYGLHLPMGTKIILFGEMSSGLMKQK
jgi:hypothetical protein